jgi:mono/diheme cytochrome c family protein
VTRPSSKRLLLIAGLLLVPACQQKMAQQPYYRPFDASTNFADGTSARMLQKGVVARGQLLDSDPLVSGLKADARRAWEGKQWDLNVTNEAFAKSFGEVPAPLLGAPNAVENFVDEFPFEITSADLNRGMERFQIFCSPCHGTLGNGKGKIAERGYLKPTSFHPFKIEPEEADEGSQVAKDQGVEGTGNGFLIPKGYSRGFGRFQKTVPLSPYAENKGDGVAPVGYFYEVITKGFGGMPAHASQIPPADRWRIVAYVRTLQFSLSEGVKAPEPKAGEPKKAQPKKVEPKGQKGDQK